MRTSVLAVVCLSIIGCGQAHDPTDAGGTDAGTTDAGMTDAGMTDAGVTDAGLTDAGLTDAGARDVGWIPLQLNDVSVLFPLTADGGQLANGYLSLSASGPQGVLLPSDLYTALGGMAGSSGNPPPGGIGFARYEDVRVVAFRLDPCFAALAPDPHGTGCKNQLRLVVQEVIDRQGVNAFDSAMHLFYSLSREELVTLAQQIAALRLAQAGSGRLGSLKAHPTVVAQGLDGAMATQLRALLLQYAGRTRLTRVTIMNAQQANFSWDFLGFDVPATGLTLVPMTIPTLPGNATTQNFFRGFATDIEGVFQPTSQSADEFSALTNLPQANQLSATDRSAKFEALVRVEHPGHHSPDTIDCGSCHLATPVERLLTAPHFGLVDSASANAFTADGTMVLPSELTPTFSSNPSFNLHAFSYVGREPGINQRTVNESAAVVVYLNTNGH